jgi:hypothetical protein
MSLDDDESIFESALRADLPNAEQQDRVRARLVAAGVAVGSTLVASSAAGAAQTTWGAALVAKVSGLSWPMTLGLAAVVATPLVAAPLWLAPTASHRAAHAPLRALRKGEPQRLSTARSHAATNPAAAAKVLDTESPSAAPDTPPRNAERPASGAVAPAVRAEEPSPGSSELPAVAAFDSLSVPDGNTEPNRQRAPSTLAAETRLLDRAFAELAAGNRTAAAALITEHQRRFPNGLLREERERARARLSDGTRGE